MAKIKNFFKSKKSWKQILIIGLAVVTLVGAIVGLSALFKKSEETTKEINPTYAIGGLTEQGAYLETEESIYTEDAFECQGLDIELDFKSNVSYRVFFYDSGNDFLSSTSKQTSNYDETTTPTLARYARIVITPNDDTEIKWYEKSGYANQLTISVNKEQDALPFENDKNYAVLLGAGKVDAVTGVYSANAEYPFYFFESIDLSNADEMVVRIDKDVYNSTISYNETELSSLSFYFDGTGNGVTLEGELVNEDDSFYYMSYDVSSYSSVYVYTSAEGAETLAVYLF